MISIANRSVSKRILICLAVFLIVAVLMLSFVIGCSVGFNFGREYAIAIRASDVIESLFVGFSDDIAALSGGDVTRIIIAYNGFHIIDQIYISTDVGLLQLNTGAKYQRLSIEANRRYDDRVYFHLPQSIQTDASFALGKLSIDFYSSGRILFTEIVRFAFGFRDSVNYTNHEKI